MHNEVQARQTISNLLLAGMLLLGLAGLGAASESPAIDAGGPEEIKNSIDMELILIPSGSFQMGVDKSFEAEADATRHSVTISTPFYMGKHEVTQKQWAAIMGRNPSKFKGSTRPVEQVSWDDVQKFIAALNQKEGKHYRLPTEAEWEYAARAGTKTAYFFGDDEDDEGLLSQYAWFKGNSGKKTHPVGMLLPNAWGLYDMHGNVWEWCQDWYDKEYYAKSPDADPSGPLSGSDHVIRGGSWNKIPYYLKAGYRNYATPDGVDDTLGFRLVLPVQQMAGSQAEKDQQAAAGR